MWLSNRLAQGVLDHVGAAFGEGGLAVRQVELPDAHEAGVEAELAHLAVALEELQAPRVFADFSSTPRGPVLHADLYRLAGEDEMEELGLFDAPEAIVLVEWPERAPSLAGRSDVLVRLSVPPGGDGRNADITFRDGRPFV